VIIGAVGASAERTEARVATAPRTAEPLSTAYVESACQRIKDGKPLNRAMAPWGRVHIDRQLPFLVVYRRPANRKDPGTDRFVRGEASYLICPGDRKLRAGVSSLIESIAAVLSESFGAFLLIEVWTAQDGTVTEGGPPHFRVLSPPGQRLGSTIEVLDGALSEVKLKGEHADVDTETHAKPGPPGLSPLLTPGRAAELNCRQVGIEIAPVFRDLARGESFPLVRRVLHRGLSRALKRAVYDFTRRQTSHRPPHYEALGKRSFVKAVWDVDRALAEISNSYDFLLQVTPVDADKAWTQFRRNRFEAEPEFSTRPLRLDPVLTKRRLFQVPIERIDDPTLAQLFRDQQAEMDRKLTMLGDRGTPRFLYGSLQVFGGVDDSLLSTAFDILNRIPPRSRDESLRGAIDATTFAARAEQELAYYRGQYPEIRSRVEIRKDVAGLMVSRGNLLVAASSRIPPSRVDALLAHEVGTHVLTYVNGKAQPFRQLYVGLPGYEELQEGLAVLSEYLAGGLSRPRLRLLAARVVAVHRLIEGASFVEVFRELDRAHDFAQRTAFSITMRVFRGGGLTKDVAYLRGLVDLLRYLREGGNIEQLLVGKFGPEHLPIIEELRWRKVLVDTPLRPRHLDDPAATERLARLRMGASVLDLVKRRRA
jgi:uncharacterized protein (TIGR02421 family)